MATSVYQMNKGINRSIEFKGLQAQYIWYVAFLLLGLIGVYFVLFIIGLSQYIAIMIVAIIGVVGFTKILKLSNTYGEHGLMKVMAKRSLPKVIRCKSRHVFIQLQNRNK
ncbi:DUF4133 domain-containing protein [Sphingobacterium yanglingense]|uniref:Uncharacterized protein DUF4133 n=1 Tax=Sphingobacterium yanglingense TaxID=1437280 RepID=A0A4R6W8U0_9SPHI|nr:DUF4133 domain-containing protein [Sphingobacterium yanglingense]TDQ73812.1 uncharacterized protein DUF4133 [Sphingobacterium yanglingense]